jgi:hypothetical protein
VTNIAKSSSNGGLASASSTDVSSSESKVGLTVDESRNSESSQRQIEPKKEVTLSGIISKQPETERKVSKLNKPWKIQRTEDELEKRSKEILALDKDPMKALQKALLMPKFFSQDKPGLK